MVIWHVWAAVRRHPMVALAGLLVTLMVALMVHRYPPVYSTRASAIFLNPLPAGVEPGQSANPYAESRVNLVSAAGVVARMLDQGGSGTRSGSDAVSLVGQGVKSGYSIVLPNSGGQWVYRFEKAQLDIQVVGRNPAEVQRLLDGAMAEIRAALKVREDDIGGIPDDQRIRVAQSPLVASIVPQSGNARKATAIALVVGAFATLSLVVALGEERRRLPFARRRRPDPTPTDLPPMPEQLVPEQLVPEPSAAWGRGS